MRQAVFVAATNPNLEASRYPLSWPLSFPNIHIEGGPIVKEIKFNPQGTEAVSNRESPMILLSVAGSGKTMVLTENVIHLIEEGFDPARLLAHVEEANRVKKSSLRGKVNLMTIHQAKGLEFKCVMVPGLNEGILPHVNSLEQLIMNLEEERRLMYVAMTRVMERLIITYGKRQMGQPITLASRFLKGIQA
jgi:superfamily I DNA/RNA helicase